MSPSFLTYNVERTSELLRKGAEEEVSEYEQRFRSLKDLYPLLLAKFLITNFSYKKAYKTAHQFFGAQKIRFAGVDGTMYSNPLYDLMIFFGGAYAATGTVTFHENSEPTVKYDSEFLKKGAGISSVIPIYIHEVQDVDQAFFDLESLVDQNIISNATIANWIMTFAEYYLAYKLVCDSEKDVRILFMDRTLSGELASLLYDTSKREPWKAKANLVGYEVDGVPIDEKELACGRFYVREPVLGLPPPRADYLLHAILCVPQEKSPFTLDEVCQNLGINNSGRRKRVKRYLKKLEKDEYVTETDLGYEFNPRYQETWSRLKKLVETFGDRFFFDKAEGNKMRIVKGGREHWLTTLDVAFLTLFCLEMLIEECWRKKVLLIGVTKDTAARDFKRQLIPILQNEGLLEGSVEMKELEKLPNTDRMILQAASLYNPDKIKVPWTLIEHDSCFRTMIPDRERGKGYVLGARRNRIGLEKLFLKSYIQLSQAVHDPRLRSNVLLTDRLVYPEFDVSENSVLSLRNAFGSALEPLEVLLFKDQSVENPLQNLVMVVLESMVTPSIPEAFGHNKPLFIADKVAKWHYASFKKVVDGVREWILNNYKLRKFVFYMSTFRERRSRIEAARREIL